MILASSEEKKTFYDMSRDYRAGILAPQQLPYISSVPSDCILIKGPAKKPGEIVPLYNFSFYGARQGVTDPEYERDVVFGFQGTVGTYNELDGFSESGSFVPVPFGVARDFITPDTYGKVQIHGFCWALVQKTPTAGGSGVQIDDDNRYVIVRKNSRFDGKPYLQTAPDGVAEVITFGRTLSSGLTWAYLHLGHKYNHTLWKINGSSINIDKNHFLFTNGLPHSESLSSRTQVLSTSRSTTNYFPMKILQDYKYELDNYVQAVRIDDSSDWTGAGSGSYDYFSITDSGDMVIRDFDENSITRTDWPEFAMILGKLDFFRGGTFNIPFIVTQTESYIRLFGRKILAANIQCNITDIDLWNNDIVTVYLSENLGKYSTSGEPRPVIISGPTDEPVNTMRIFPSDHPVLSAQQRGWEKVLWTSSFTSDIAVLKGTGSLMADVNHTHVYYDSSLMPQNTSEAQNGNTITYDKPFDFVVYKKVTEGVRYSSFRHS